MCAFGHLICIHTCNSYCAATTHATVVAAAPWVTDLSPASAQQALDRLPCLAHFQVLSLRPITEVGALRPQVLGVPEHAHRYFLCHYAIKGKEER